MEDLKSKLQEKSKVVRHQALQRLYSLLLSRLKEFTAEKKLAKVEELELILECLIGPCCQTRIICKEILLRLVQEHLIDIRELVIRLSTLTASTRNLALLAELTGEVLLVDLEGQMDETNNYICPYNLREHPHPFVIFYRNCPKDGPVLADVIYHLTSRLLTVPNSKRLAPMALSPFKPFLHFILVSPEVEDRSTGFAVVERLLLLANLARDGSEKSLVDEILKLLFSSVFLLKTNIYGIRKSSYILQKVTRWITEHFAYDHVNVMDMVNQNLLVCYNLCKEGERFSSHLDLLDMIISHITDKIELADETLFLYALLLLGSPQAFQIDVVKHVLAILPKYISNKCRRKKHVLKAFLLPLMQIVSLEDNVTSQWKTCQKIAQNITNNLKRYILREDQKEHSCTCVRKESYQVSEMGILKSYVELLDAVERNPIHAQVFLDDFAAVENRSPAMTLIFSSLLVTSQVDERYSETYDTLLIVADRSPESVLDYLPLILDGINAKGNPRIKLKLLSTLPQLATSMVNVGPILKTIQMLATSSALLPIALRLMTKLWVAQPRIFPYLLKLLDGNVDKQLSNKQTAEEWIMAKAGTILEICTRRATQHGPDVVGTLSALFEEATSHSHLRSSALEYAISMGLDAVTVLCDEEVIDAASAWSIISKYVKDDERPAILKGLCVFFGTAALQDETGTDFRDEALNFLWCHILDQNVQVSSAAWQSLQKFPINLFKVRYLPAKIAETVKERMIKAKKIKQSEDDDPLSLLNDEEIPGFGYTALLHLLTTDTLPAYSDFLSKLIHEELQSMSRGTILGRGQKTLGKVHTKFIDEIPDFVSSSYERYSAPGLRSGLASGLLYCYTPALPISRGGKMGRRHFIDHGKMYRKMLDNMLSEVPMQAAEWYAMLLAPTAWSNFMDRVYNSTMESRKAELSLMLDQGKLDSEVEMKAMETESWLWVRDRLTEQLKKVSRGSPSEQGNSVLALGGLVYAVCDFHAMNEDSDETRKLETSIQYLPHSGWIKKVTDTLLIVADGNFKLSGEPFKWCQQVSSSKSTASSVLARSAAMIALSSLIGPLLNLDVDRVHQIIDVLSKRVPGQSKAGTSSTIQFYSSLSLGLVITKLYRHQFPDIAGQGGSVTLMKSIDVLEQACFDSLVENREGAVLGYGLALGALFMDTSKDSKVHAIQYHKKMLESVLKIEYKDIPPVLSQGFCFSLAITTAKGMQNDAIATQTVTEILNALEGAAQSCQGAVTIATALGLLYHACSVCSLSQFTERISRKVDEWQILLAAEVPDPLRSLASLHGLMSTFGSDFFLLESEANELSDIALRNKMVTIIRGLQQKTKACEDDFVCNAIYKLLGQLYMSQITAPSQRTNLPMNYNYLPETSLLRGISEALLDAGKTGSYGSGPSAAAVTALVRCLETVSKQQLPPLNWGIVLSPLMRGGFGTDLRSTCLRFAIHHAKFCSTLPTWVMSWTSRPVFSGLEPDCKDQILDNLTDLVRIVPATKLQLFIDEVCYGSFIDEEKLERRKRILSNLEKVAQLQDPPAACLMAVRNVLERMLLNTGKKDCVNGVLTNMVGCLANLPGDFLVEVLNKLKGCHLHLVIQVYALLVSKFNHPLSNISLAMDLLKDDSIDRLVLLPFLCEAVQNVKVYTSSATSLNTSLLWFFEQMAAAKAVLYDGDLLMFTCYIEVLASAALSWSSSGLFVKLPREHFIPRDHNFVSMCLNSYLELFGKSLASLLLHPAWIAVAEKVLDWLLLIFQGTKSHAMAGCIERSLLELRDTDLWNIKFGTVFDQILC